VIPLKFTLIVAAEIEAANLVDGLKAVAKTKPGVRKTRKLFRTTVTLMRLE
jgi:hypothetical protein